MTEFFGPESSSGWGAEPSEGEGDESAPSGSLGDGHFIRVNEEAWRQLMFHPAVQAAIAARAQAITNTANSLVAVDPRTAARLAKGEPAYVTSMDANPAHTRPRARVETNPDNFLGVLDDALHSTLLKSVDAHPSDPIPEGGDLGLPESGTEAAPERMTGPGFDDVE